MKQSLIIGLNSIDSKSKSYGFASSGDLVGPEKDVERMNSLLSTQGFSNRLLKAEEATRDNILSSLSLASKTLNSGDTFVFYYSGHGVQVKDTNGDEEDGFDEAFAAYDQLLLDDDIGVCLSKFKKGVKIIMISDSCNSGTNFASSQEELSRENLALNAYHRQSHGLNTLFVQNTTSPSQPQIKAEVIHLSAAEDGRTAPDTNNGGVFTSALIKIFNNGKFKGGYQSFFKRLKDECKSSFRKISPGYAELGPVTNSFREETPFVGNDSVVSLSDPWAPSLPNKANILFSIENQYSYTSEKDIQYIKSIQTFLSKHLGINLDVDGLYGKKTAAAVLSYQRSYNLNNSGQKGYIPLVEDSVWGKDTAMAATNAGFSQFREDKSRGVSSTENNKAISLSSQLV